MYSIKFLLDSQQVKIFLSKKSKKYFPGCKILSCKAIPLKIHLIRGAVVVGYRLKLVSASGKIFEKKIIGKTEKEKSRIFNDYSTVKYLKNNGLDEIVAEPIDYIKSLNLYLYNFIPGYFLQKLSEEKREKDFLSKIRPAIETLKKIHSLKIKNYAFKKEKEDTGWKRSYKLIEKYWPTILSKVNFWIEKCIFFKEKNKKIFLSSQNRLTHGDFYSRNILICKRNIKLIDFSNSAIYDPINDISNFLINTELMLEYDFPEKYKKIMKKIEGIFIDNFFNRPQTSEEIIKINYFVFKNLIRIIASTARDEGGSAKNQRSEKTMAKLMMFGEEKYKNIL